MGISNMQQKKQSAAAIEQDIVTPWCKICRRMHHKRNEVYQLFADRTHGGDGEIRNSRAGFEPPTAFRVRTLQPLGYISKFVLYPPVPTYQPIQPVEIGRTTG